MSAVVEIPLDPPTTRAEADRDAALCDRPLDPAAAAAYPDPRIPTSDGSGWVTW